ncbi:hypothetical protein FAUST_7711 [Fusarium austroamericanum]|uniref:Tc1-like transposase DDE domain-containing protein n=1 Tax=Fusarium austroamericanum TaxID=282268 RepID=A0AAN5Z6W5_FUSAU|nr:hypothetical protein FAUST_7711 [Fusarium austroamericanum]
MPRGKELSPSLRSRICELRRAGYSWRELFHRFPEIPKSTIRSTVKSEEKRGEDNLTLPRSGAPRKLTEEQRDQIFDTVTTDPHITIRDLLDSVDNAVKARSLRYLLRIDWKKVKWSDKYMVRRGQGMRPIWTFLSPREALRVQDVQEARRLGAIRQMFWAAFGHESRTPLVPLVGNVNAIGIYKLYSFILPWFLQPGDIFMHDNASVHIARIVKVLLEELGVNLMALMKAEIYRLHPELTHAEDTVAIQHALVLAAMEAWDSIEESILQNLCETMPNRVNAVIAAEVSMTSIGRLACSAVSAVSEITVAAASLNFDFSLVKVEAPREFHDLGQVLSHGRRREAEDGALHTTARRLAGLFGPLLERTPDLYKAYGTRSSEIVSNRDVNPVGSKEDHGIFFEQVGADCTSIWAAATSGDSAVAMHLLACMLARIWEPDEAISVWVDIVAARKLEIQADESLCGLEKLISDAAARQQISREQLAQWDTSARAWLRCADEANGIKKKQTQLLLILKNIAIAVNSITDTYKSVMHAWKSAMVLVENLLLGQPQEVRDGAILLGLSAWHLYPDLLVLGNTVTQVKQQDNLVAPGGILTLGLAETHSDQGHCGVSWSLPLASLNFYGDPITSTQTLDPDTSRLSSRDLSYVGLGSLLYEWDLPSTTVSQAVECLVELWAFLCRNVGGLGPLSAPSRGSVQSDSLGLQPWKWLKMLCNAARSFLDAQGVERERACRLIQFGRRRAEQFLSYDTGLKTNFLGLLDSRAFIGSLRDTETKISYLRQWASRSFSDKDTVLQYKVTKPAALSEKRYRYSQQSTVLDVIARLEGSLPDGTTRSEETQVHFETRPSAKGQIYILLWGKPGDAAIFVNRKEDRGDLIGNDTPSKFLSLWTLALKTDAVRPDILNQILGVAMRENKDYFTALDALSIAYETFENMPGATIDPKVASHPLKDSQWYISYATSQHLLYERTREEGRKQPVIPGMTLEECLAPAWQTPLTRCETFACIAFFDTGNTDIQPDQLGSVMAISCGNSIYIALQLLKDPSKVDTQHQVRRIAGNIGQAGIGFLVPPAKPRVRAINNDSWQVINHNSFDERQENSFGATSCHLSFTNYRMPIALRHQVHGRQDVEAYFIETVASIYDCGKWVGDLDILGSLASMNLIRVSHDESCVAEPTTSAVLNCRLTSIDNWEEFLDRPKNAVVARAHRNWLARLVLTSFAIERGYKVFVFPESVCWSCCAKAHMSFGDYEVLIL